MVTNNVIRDIAVPLQTVAPDDDHDDSDLETLRTVAGNARVVCLGESAHYVSEFYQLRDRLTRFLVRELGFSAVVLESGLPEGLLVNDWIGGGPCNVADVARRGITYAAGQCAEMHAQLRWLRAWNTTHNRQVRFYGMDMPGWCTNPRPGVEACLTRLSPEPGDAELVACSDLSESITAPTLGQKDAATVPAGLPAAMTSLISRSAATQDRIALQCALGAESVVEFRNQGLYPGPGRNLRNEVMVNNLRWILNHEDRVVIIAHNVHLQRTVAFDGTASITGLLAPMLGDDLVVVGTTHGPANIPRLELDARAYARFVASPNEPQLLPPNSLDATMDAAGYPLHVVDLRRASCNAVTATTKLAQGIPMPLDPMQAFDAIIHIQDVTPVHGANDQPD